MSDDPGPYSQPKPWLDPAPQPFSRNQGRLIRAYRSSSPSSSRDLPGLSRFVA
jgi:hypothetical protein